MFHKLILTIFIFFLLPVLLISNGWPNEDYFLSNPLYEDFTKLTLDDLKFKLSRNLRTYLSGAAPSRTSTLKKRLDDWYHQGNQKGNFSLYPHHEFFNKLTGNNYNLMDTLTNWKEPPSFQARLTLPIP